MELLCWAEYDNSIGSSTRCKAQMVWSGSKTRYLTLDVRMDSLYYDANFDRLPHDAYDLSFALNLIPEVHLFAREVWKEIR